MPGNESRAGLGEGAVGRKTKQRCLGGLDSTMLSPPQLNSTADEGGDVTWIRLVVLTVKTKRYRSDLLGFCLTSTLLGFGLTRTLLGCCLTSRFWSDQYQLL